MTGITPIRAIIAAALCFVFSELAMPAKAQDLNFQQLGMFRDWRAYTFQENGATVCSMASNPTRKEHNNRPRGEVYAFVTHRPAQERYFEVSFVAGYTYEPASEVTVEIGSDTFRLFTEGDSAWARDPSTDRELAGAIRRGNRMIVRGLSSRGTRTTDTYSLSGSSNALDAINNACNVTE